MSIARYILKFYSDYIGPYYAIDIEDDKPRPKKHGFVSGACLVRAGVFGFVSGACLVRVWVRVWFVSVRVWFVSGSCLVRVWVRVWIRSLDIKYLPAISPCRHDISISPI